MRTVCAILAASAVMSAGIAAERKQSAPTAAPAPIVATAPVPVMALPQPNNQVVLPSNTELTLRMNEDLSSKNAREGDTFHMTLVENVLLNGYVVIPKGARAGGEVKWKTGKGAFGKSGKMDVELRYIEVAGRRLPIAGSYRQEGEGNTVATIGGVVLVGVFAAFVTGKSALIPRGRELVAHTIEDLPVLLPTGTASAPAPAVYVASAGVVTPAAVGVAAQPAGVMPVAASVAYSDEVALIPAKTASGYCIRAAADYRGTGSRAKPAITSGMPRCQ